MRNPSLFGLTWVVAALLTTLTATAQISDKVVIQGGRIIPVVGEEIASGNILIENGKITAIGPDVKAPFDAMVIDVKGKTVFPGMIDAMTAKGLDVANEHLDVASFVHVLDAIDPSDRYFEQALRHGLTSIHVCQGNDCVVSGVSRVVRPIGLSVTEMTVRGDGGLKVSFTPKSRYDPAAQMAVLRDTFDELDRYLERLAEKLYEEDLAKKDEDLTVGPEEARKLGKKLVTLAKIDDKHRNLARLAEGRLDVYAHCALAMEVARALEWIKKMGLEDRATISIGSDAHKAARLLKQAKRPVVLAAGSFVHREIDRITKEPKDTFVPKVLVDAGVPFAIADTLRPWYDAARCVRNGVSRQAALEAVTINAARAIGLGDRMGSLEKGKDGNLLILSGDPLDTTTWIEDVFIEGRHVYDRTKDKRLRDLLQGIHDSAADDRKRAEEAARKKAEEMAKKKADEPSGKKDAGDRGGEKNGEPKKKD